MPFVRRVTERDASYGAFLFVIKIIERNIKALLFMEGVLKKNVFFFFWMVSHIL